MKIVIIIQARMTSTRLPGKILKEVLGKPLLEYQIKRLRRIVQADEIVLATTTNETDQPVVEFCRRVLLPCHRGSEEDVLARMYGAAVAHGADVVVRVTGDCPLIDPDLSGKAIQYFLDCQKECDYVVMKYPHGMDTEVCSFQALHEAFAEAVAKPDREHVTTFIHRQPERYRLKWLPSEESWKQYRWTVDTPEDFEVVRRIIEGLYPAKPDFTVFDIIDFIDRNPELRTINSEIKQKCYGE